MGTKSFITPRRLMPRQVHIVTLPKPVELIKEEKLSKANLLLYPLISKEGTTLNDMETSLAILSGFFAYPPQIGSTVYIKSEESLLDLYKRILSGIERTGLTGELGTPYVSYNPKVLANTFPAHLGREGIDWFLEDLVAHPDEYAVDLTKIKNPKEIEKK